MLSKLERGKLFPTLPTLLRIAMVFGVGLDFFFTDERKRHVVSIVRKQERLKFPENAGSSVIAYNFESLDFKASERKLNAFYAEFEMVPAEKVRPHQHAGVELLYLISGKLELIISSDRHVLEEGDADRLPAWLECLSKALSMACFSSPVSARTLPLGSSPRGRGPIATRTRRSTSTPSAASIRRI
jgi:quercetin dioxygenase-like cupin family protein